MLRLTLLVSAIISFLYFAFPQSFTIVKKSGDVLGITKFEAMVNKQTISTALNIYCINNGHLPESLNELYKNELSKRSYLDLDKVYSLKKIKDCDFELNSK